MSSELSITLHYYVANEERPGYSKYHRTATPQEIADEINAVLGTISIENGECTLKEAYEWLSIERELVKTEPLTDKMPQDVLLQTMFRHGNCEGYIIEIILFDRITEKYSVPISIKFLTNEDDVWRGVRAISNAIREGQFN
jgi:hypothetical protein